MNKFSPDDRSIGFLASFKLILNFYIDLLILNIHSKVWNSMRLDFMKLITLISLKILQYL